MKSTIIKWLVALPAGALAMLAPNVPFIIIAFAFIAGDCWSAYRLARRVKKYKGRSTAKVKSKKLWKVVQTAALAMSIIVLADTVEKHILVMYKDLYMANWASLAVCIVQCWSILENESSCHGSRWASLLQKIMIDKSERHFDVDLSELKKEVEEGK